MATLRNLAIGLIRQAGYTKIAATIRKIKYDTALLIAILGLRTPHDQQKRLWHRAVRVHVCRAVEDHQDSVHLCSLSR